MACKCSLGYVCVKQLLTLTIIGIDISIKRVSLSMLKTHNQCLYLANGILISNEENSVMGSQPEIVMTLVQQS